MPVEEFMQWIWAPISAVIAWIIMQLAAMRERLVRVEAIAVGTETMRAIMKEETNILRGEMHLLRDQINEVRESVSELGRNVARRRREDQVE